MRQGVSITADPEDEQFAVVADRRLDAKRAGRGIADNTEKTYREALAAWGRERRVVSFGCLVFAVAVEVLGSTVEIMTETRETGRREYGGVVARLDA